LKLSFLKVRVTSEDEEVKKSVFLRCGLTCMSSGNPTTKMVEISSGARGAGGADMVRTLMFAGDIGGCAA
jgi:hypothetical protein